MGMFGASPRESYDAFYSVLNQPGDVTAREREEAAGTFVGNPATAAVTGIYRGWSRGASVLGNAATPALRPIAKTIDEMFGTKTDDWLLGEQEKANRALFDSKLDPKTYGTATQLVYGITDVLTTLATTRNPALMGGVYGISQAGVGMNEGLDARTATVKGAIEGAAMGVAVALPAAIPGSLALRAASGAAINAGIGIPQRALVSSWLNARGYPEMARQYEPFDATSIATELALGAAFGGLLGPRAKANLPAPEAVPPSAVDAALTANQATHAEIHSAPGVPTDTRSRQAHVAALDQAVEALVMGREVNVEALLRDAGFVGKRPDFDALKVIADELERAGAKDVVAQVRAIEAEAKARGLYVEPDALGSVVLSDKPVESRVAGTAGRESQVRIGDDYVPTRLVLVEATDVAATMTKADNQFRDRTRVASEQQIQDIASRLDAHLLMDAPVMDYGAPVLAADGTVIGGNGRAAAVNRAYEIGTAQAYRDALRAEFGDAVDGMQRPMLVRVLQREVDVPMAAILSNEGGGLRMSALEQAKVDAERLGDFRAFQFSEDGAVDLAANMPFVRGWVEQMPVNQRAAIMDADGRLSAEGAKRLQNAILFRAYGDSPTLARLVEATDPGSRNIAAALTRVAPAVADAREAIERGDLYPMGLHDDLIAAVEKLEALRSQGMAVDTWLKQIDAFGDGMTAEARLLVEFMNRNIRASRAISEGVFGFYNRLMEAGNPKQGSMFEASQPDKGRMLALALEEPMYGRGTGQRATAADLTTAFRAMFGRDADRLMEAGRVRVVQSVADLPGSGHPSDVGGMFWRGEAWVVADNTGIAQMRGRVLHEVGEHAGMEQMLGKDLYQQVLDTVARKAETDPVFKEAQALAEARANKPEHVPAETLAYLVENAPELPVVRRILAAVRQWVYRTTGGRFVDLTQADLQMMAVASLRRYAREAEIAAKGEDAPWYMAVARAIGFDQTQTENFKRWSNDAAFIGRFEAETHQFKTGEKIVVEAYHGTQRPDRVGNVFKKSRATSGPMAFHTSSPDLASSYATGKQDTSLAYEDQHYSTWFKYKPKGQRSDVDIVRAWYGLEAETKSKIEKIAPTLRMDDEGNVVAEDGNKTGNGSYDYNLEQTKRGWDRRGNPLNALVEDWLNSGNLFNDEEKFLQVLAKVGFPVKDVTYDSPHASYPFVYKNFIEMQNPLVTSDVPQSVIDALQQAAKRDRTRPQKGGADIWDKNTRTLREWVANFTDPNNSSKSYVWTSIPDKVTDVFRSLGYDGIVDWSGKGGGGEVRPVYIPFEQNQIKSAIGNKGTFRDDKSNILFSRDGKYPTRESVEAFHAAADSRAGGGRDTMSAADPIEDTTMPGARDSAAQADAETAQAKELSQGFMPAVECFLRVGE